MSAELQGLNRRGYREEQNEWKVEIGYDMRGPHSKEIKVEARRLIAFAGNTRLPASLQASKQASSQIKVYKIKCMICSMGNR